METEKSDKTPEDQPSADNEATDNAISQIEAEEKIKPPEPLPEEHQEPLIVQDNKEKPRFYKSWKFWTALIFILLATVTILWFIKPTRLVMVNSLGLKTNLKISTVTPAERGQKRSVIKNVTIKINQTEYNTDENGNLQTDLPYGDVNIVAEKPGYDTVNKQTSLDFDPFFYQLGGQKEDKAARNIRIELKSVGIELRFKALDWLTDKPLTVGEFSVGDVVASPNQNGEVSIKIPTTDAKEVEIQAKFVNNYANKKIKLKTKNDSVPEIKFAPAGKNYFISNRTGKYVVYSSNIDGTNVTPIIKEGESEETGDITFTVSPNGKYGVLASTRGGKRDAGGILQQKMYLYNVKTKTLTPYDQAERFSFIDWHNDTLAYVAEVNNPATNQPTQRVKSYDVTNGKVKTIGQASSFIAGRVSGDSLVYLARSKGDAKPELRLAKLSGGSKNLGYNILRLTQIASDRFAYQASDKEWHEYNLNTNQISNAAPPASAARAMLNSPSGDGQNRLVVDKVDGTPALLAQKISNGTEKRLYSNPSISGPVRWAGNAIIFRVVDENQAADYAVSLLGGKPKKITNVTAQPPEGDYFLFN